MITVSEARQLIAANSLPGRTEQRTLSESLGYVLAEDVRAVADIPPFPQSAMDGYAFSFADLQKSGTLRIAGEIPAGDTRRHVPAEGEALRIFTGAPVPPACDTVVMQEKCRADGQVLYVEDSSLNSGANVRPQGSQSKQNEILLHAGHVLSAPSLAFLASSGIDRVTVRSKPVVRILVTGKELIKPGQKLDYGQVYECNSYGLEAALESLRIPAEVSRWADDDPEIIRAAIHEMLYGADVLLITGGVSVGDHDHVHGSLLAAGAEKIFHKIRQKPGKPIWFGKRGDTLVFGLPGNPASVLSCFYEYTVPALAAFTGLPLYRRQQLPLTKPYSKKAGLTHFLKARKHENGVEILPDQNSYLLNSFAHADLLAEIPEEAETLPAGTPVQVTQIT